MSTPSYDPAKYDAMAKELAGLNFKRLQPAFFNRRPNPRIHFDSSRVYATCSEEGCNEEGWLVVATLKKGREIRCPRHWMRGTPGHPVTREARDTKCREALAPLGLQGLQMVPQTPAPSHWDREQYSYICPLSGCSNRIGPYIVKTILRHGTANPFFCSFCKQNQNYEATLLDWGFEDGVFTNLRTRTDPRGKFKVCHQTSRAQVRCQGHGKNGERCGQPVERCLATLREAALSGGLQSIRCSSCKYLTVTFHHYEFVVMNGYEGRSVRIAISDRCMPVGVVHTTHNVWVEIAPKGGILLECGSVACIRGAKRLVDLVVATNLPSGLRTNGSDSVVLNQENYAEWKERLGLGKTLDGLRRPLDAVETKGESTIIITPYLIETMLAFKALGLVYEVWCYRTGSDTPSIFSTEKELEAGIDRCRRRFRNLVHAPKRFTDVEEAKTFFEAQAARRMTKRSAKRSADDEEQEGLPEEVIMELEDEMHRGAFADV